MQADKGTAISFKPREGQIGINLYSLKNNAA